MLTITEKNKIKDILSEGLGIRRDINLAYFLDEIDSTSEDVKHIKAQISTILNNQRILDNKLNTILNYIKNIK